MDEKEEGAAGGISQKPLQPLIRGSPFILKEVLSQCTLLRCSFRDLMKRLTVFFP